MFVNAIVHRYIVSLTSNHSPSAMKPSVSFTVEELPTLGLRDLERLKDPKKWLSDSHIDLALQCVLSFPLQ
jgi:hypothetical protein